jgi:hypothetical protein
LPLFGRFSAMSLSEHERRLEEGRRPLADCPPGLTHFVIHRATDSPELRAMAPDWRSRVADLALSASVARKEAAAASGVRVIGFRAIREALRAG